MLRLQEKYAESKQTETDEGQQNDRNQHIQGIANGIHKYYAVIGSSCLPSPSIASCQQRLFGGDRILNVADH